jgi:hypothetical protein
MESNEVSHKEIYDRLCEVEAKVDKVANDTEGMVKAFNDAQGAFHVLEWIAKIAKPVLWTVGSIAAIVAILQDYRSH